MKRRELLLAVFLPLVPVLALGARLFSQSGHLEDGEGQIPATIGRELSLGAWRDVFHYQLIEYQGSLVLDPALSVPGYLLLGDHLLAWHSVALFYGLVLGLSGALVLYRCCGRIGLFVFPALVAGMPFLLKDGLLGLLGGHASGFAIGLAALACVLWSGNEGKRRWLALGAGVLWGLGVWYVRTTYVVLPALLLGLLPVWRAGLPRFVVGAGVLPLLLLFNAWGLVTEVPRFQGNDVSGMAAHLAFDRGGFAGADEGGPEVPVSALAEGSGWVFRGVLFEQPPPVRSERPQALPGTRLVGLSWVLAWWLGLPLAVLAWFRRRPPGGGGSAPGVARHALHWVAVGTFCAGYIAAYLVAPHRVEPEVVQMALSGRELTSAPAINPVRYLPPIYLAWTLLLGLGTAAAWQARLLRIPALLLLLATAGAGSGLAVADLVVERQSEQFSERRPYRYASIALPGRLPPLEVHRAALSDDPESREHHLRAMGMLLVLDDLIPAGLAVPQVGILDALWEELSLSQEDRCWMVEGLGTELANDTIGRGGAALIELMQVLEQLSEGLDPAEQDALYAGAGGAIDLQLLREEAATFVPLFCSSGFLRQPHLCRGMAQVTVDSAAQSFPADPGSLFSESVVWEELEPYWQGELLGGAAEVFATSGDSLDPERSNLDSWPLESRQIFLDAWRRKRMETP